MSCPSEVFLFNVRLACTVQYADLQIDAAPRIDIWVNRSVIIEVKAVETLLSVHQAQLLTYLKLTGNRLGLLINFNVHLLKDGVKRLII